MTKNYNLEMEKIISEEYNRDMPRKKLLLHACCAPCATACLERVKDFFDVAVFFYNPNIDCREEYEKRAEELKRLCGIVGTECVTEDYCADEFLYAAQGTEDMHEGGERCARCFKLRLERTAALAAEKGFDYFGTTLTVSPHKNAEQVNAAQQEALDHGMTLGLMQDMAVGVHGLGADAWANPERFASGGVTVGCPPDFYNQQGQDWGQPPFNPRYLEATGYQVYREMVHSMYEHAGAVRIDHVLGLFRLWWIPQGLGARNGAYVTYNHEAMLGVLAIEATRAGGMVVGEDLGTVPDYVRRILADHGVLGTDVEWFNRVDDSPNAGDPYRAPKDYRKQALASVTTHDLPPTAGYLNFAHVKLREELHLLSEPVEAFAASAMAERTAMMNRLVENGYISQTVADDVEGHVQEIVEAMHAMLTDTPSLLLQAALVDGVGECRSQNQPGTSREYSNWRVPLADSSGHVVHTDEVFDLPRVQSLSAVMRREKR